MNGLAPVILFVYNRPHHLTKVIDGLKLNKECRNTPLIIYSDAAKSKTDLELVNSTRKIIRNISGFQSLKIIEQERNKGLADSIIDGVTEQFENYESLIILEDDLVPSKFFLNYMNTALQLYSGSEKISSVHAYCYPVLGYLPSTFFIKGADCWGWGTWKSNWDNFEKDGTVLYQELKRRNLFFSFNMYGGYNYRKMLLDQINGRNNSWAIRWHAWNYLQGKLTLYPNRSLVENIGTDGSGSNFTKTDPTYKTSNSVFKIPVERSEIKEDIFARNKFILYHYRRKLLILLSMPREFIKKNLKLWR